MLKAVPHSHLFVWKKDPVIARVCFVGEWILGWKLICSESTCILHLARFLSRAALLDSPEDYNNSVIQLLILGAVKWLFALLYDCAGWTEHILACAALQFCGLFFSKMVKFLTPLMAYPGVDDPIW